MGCGCGKGKKSGSSSKTHTVQLKGGLKVTKSSESEAKAFAAKHPGSKIIVK